MIRLNERTGALVVHCAAYDVEELRGDGLLAALVVLQVELAQQLIGIVGGSLHGHHAYVVGRKANVDL